MRRGIVTLAFVAVLVVSLPAGVAGTALAAGPPAGASTGDGGSVDATATYGGATMAAIGYLRAIPAGGSTALADPTVAAIGGPTAAAIGDPSAAASSRSPVAASTGGSEDVLHRTTTLRHLPDRPGEFETEKTFDVPDPILEFEVDLGERATVEATDGFVETDEGTYRWTGDVDRPSIRFTMPANRSDDVSYHAPGGGDGYTFVDTGEWGVVRVPGIDVTVRRTSPVGFDETVVVDGPGATGGDVAFFGEVTEYERTVGGETIRFVVPEAAEDDLADDPVDVVDALAVASERLDVGARSDEVFVLAVPADVDWGPEGLHYGDSNVWVVADRPLEVPANVWFHEYVHTRQGYAHGDDVGTTTETGWLVEAQAEYYAATLGFEMGLIEFDEFARFLEAGARSPYADGTLSDPDTWADERTHYVKGRLVYGEIDRQLRLATDGDRTAADVFRVLNAGEGRLTEDAFETVLEKAGGPEVRAVAERYAGTAEAPEMWGQTAHGEAFELQGATFEYGPAGGELEAAGETWALLDGDAGEAMTAVPADALVRVPVAVDNVGDRDGTADVALEVDGEVVDVAQPTLAAGDGTTVALNWAPPEPGAYDLRIGDEVITVFVRSSATVAVTDLDVAPTSARPTEPVTATATIENGGAEPTAAIIAVRTYEGVVAEHPVLLAGGESTTITETVGFDDAGEYEVAVGEQSATVVVETPPPAELEEVPGFGPVATLVVLAYAALALAGRSSTRS